MKKLIVAVISTISLVSGSSNNVVKKKKSELNKWNKTTTNKYYKPSTLVKTGLKTTNTVLNFVLFLLSIPLVWYTRDLSLIITKLIKNGWTKL